MPRGKYTNHKGRARRFTSTEELEEQSKSDSFTARRKPKKEESSDGSENGSEDSSQSESEDDEAGKAKGVERLIEVENPNRVQKKSKKLSTLNETLEDSKPELSRREREEVEKAKATAYYHKLHAEGKTEEARADLARLAIIKKQREEAAAKREQERLAKEAAKQAKTAATNKALGKKS